MVLWATSLDEHLLFWCFSLIAVIQFVILHSWLNKKLIVCRLVRRFGTSVGGGLLSALLCWPSPWVVLIGALASSVGAALQCLTSMSSTQFIDTL